MVTSLDLSLTAPLELLLLKIISNQAEEKKLGAEHSRMSSIILQIAGLVPSDLLEVLMTHSFFGSQTFLQNHVSKSNSSNHTISAPTYLMIIPQQLIQKINSIIANEPLILLIDKRMPILLREPPQNIIVLRVQLDIVLVQIIEQILRPQHLGNLDQLIAIAIPMEERLFPEYHAREHSPQTPHIETVIVLLEIHEQLGSLEISARDAHIVLRPRMIELRQTPINQPQFPALVINHNIMRLDIPMHDPLAMTKVQCLEQLIDVIPDVVVLEFGVQRAEIGVINVLEDE